MNPIQKALADSNFKSEYQKAIAGILFTSRWLENFYQKQMTEYGITWQQFYLLRILKTQHPEKCNLNFIKEKMIDKSSDVSRIAERLRVMGLIVRDANKKDRRHVEVSITKKGRDLLDRIKKRDHEIEGVLYNLSPKEIKVMNELLQKIFEQSEE